jgi:membrane protein YdbS with pleckstrin-like domain
VTTVPARGLDAGVTGWHRVSSRLIWVELVAVLVAAVGGLVVGIALLLAVDWVGWTIIGIVAVVTLTRLVLVPRRIRSIGYVLRDDDLVVRRGLLFSRLVAVPYGRMQLIDVNRGLIARALGLAELRLVTAAASSDVTIPGLPEQEAADLRDALVARAEERRVGL